MCGLVGFSGKTEFNLRTMELLIAWNSLDRGEDATGIYSPKNGLKKSLIKGSYFVTYKQPEYFEPDTLFVGHVRAATVGAKDQISNAHPFKRGPYVLAHNGTLRNHRDLLYKYNLLSGTFNVDSDCVAASIEACNDIATVLSEINGAGAFIIYDERKKDKLYVFRNKERPLWRGYDDEGNMYISSMPEPLAFEGLSKIKEFKEDILYSIANGVISTNRSETKNIKNNPYERPTSSYYSTNYDNDAEIDGYMGYSCGHNNHGRNGSFNTPLVPVVTHNNNVSKHDVFENLWMRAKVDVSYFDEYQGRRIELKKDKYYLMSGDSNAVKRVWVNDNDNDWYETEKNYFDMQDIITKDNLICLLEDNTKNTNDRFIGNKGDIFVVSNVYADSDLSLKKYGNSYEAINGYIHKRAVRKLTREEKEAFISAVNGYGLMLNELPTSIYELKLINALESIKNENNESVFTAESNFEPTENDFPELDEFNTSVERIVNDKQFNNFFEGLEKHLKDLRGLTFQERIQDKVTDIINYMTVEKDKLINNGINV